jgi:glycogen debranching enzyme
MAGSYVTFLLDAKGETHRVHVGTVSKGAITYKWQTTGGWSEHLFDIQLLRNGSELTYSATARPDQLQLTGDGCVVTIVFAALDTVVLDWRGCDVRIAASRSFAWAYQPAADRFAAFDSRSIQYISAKAASGTWVHFEPSQVDGDCLLLSAGGIGRVSLRIGFEERENAPAEPDLQRALQSRQREVSSWMSHTPRASVDLEAAAKTAWFLFWNLQVAPRGGYTRTTILSSKRVMDQIWSWDNCFNALAVADADIALAWDQLLVLLDQQLPNGVLPDAVNDYHPVYGFNKPPIWGWTVHRLLKKTPRANRGHFVGEVYEKIARFHRWWLQHRDLVGDGLPFYMNGNDSGWDNATIFDERWPVQSPDLAAHLILEAEGLAEMAAVLGREAEAADWSHLARRMLELFTDNFVRGEALVYRVLTPEGVKERSSTSLLTRIPVILGRRLPVAVTNRIVAELSDSDNFFAPSGPSSESLSSGKYEPNGYWRGPVWGPSTLLICDGLIESGHSDLAKQIAERFCATCSKDAVFWENYDAKTGAGQYDSGMTWSAADFLLLASWLAGDRSLLG